MAFTIDKTASTPPFEQLRDQLIDQIRRGDLSPGTKLPPVRTLAVDLGLAANTVAKTYRELESSGFVQTRGRHGTVVAPTLGDPEQHRSALALTRDYLAAMSAIGLSAGAVPDYLKLVRVDTTPGE